MAQATKIITLFFLLTSIQAFAQQTQNAKSDSSLQGLLIPTLIAVIGFLGKSVYELFLERRKRKIQNIVDKLKLFYWPIFFRLEKNNAIWDEILCRTPLGEDILDKRISDAERSNILKNYKEILDIIDKYVYLAEPDEASITMIKEYIIRVTHFKALEESNEVIKIPLKEWAEAERSDKFFESIKTGTAFYQYKLNKMAF